MTLIHYSSDQITPPGAAISNRRRGAAAVMPPNSRVTPGQEGSGRKEKWGTKNPASNAPPSKSAALAPNENPPVTFSVSILFKSRMARP